KEVFYKDFKEPGMVYSPELVKWFHDMEITCLSTDTIGNECTINPGNGMMIPLHGALMRNLGVIFNEICNFESLADDCHQDGQWDQAGRAGNALDRLAGRVAAEAERRRPDDAAQGVEHEELAPRHLDGAGEDGREHAQHGHEAAEEHDLAAVPVKHVAAERE